jgi:hypothetical protein
MWALSYGPPSFGRDCRLGLALRRQESLGFECSHAALPSRGHRLAIDIVPHTSQHILSYLSHTFWLGRSEVEEDLVDQLFNSSEKRLARILLLLANLAPFHSITSLEACTTLSRPEPEYDARYSYNTLQNTICRKTKE